MKSAFIFFIIMIPVFVQAQTVSIRGVVVEETKTAFGTTKEEPVPDLPLRITHYSDCLTTDSGEFMVNVPENVHQLEIKIRDGASWILLYPKDPFPVPADLTYITKIYVTKAAVKVLATNEYEEGNPVY